MMAQTVQTFDFLSDLVRRVRTGSLVPAAFQRQYVWSRRDVEEMWASIADHDPLGAILLWRPEDEETVERLGRSRLGPVELVPSRRSALILDGQNRLVTLAWSMFDPDAVSDDAPGSAVWKADGHVLAADAVTVRGAPRIAFMPRDEVRGLVMPVWKLFDNAIFNRHVREAWDDQREDDDILEWLTRLQEAAMQARVVVSTIEGGDAAEARRRFLRIARVGVPMSAADFDEIAQTS